jgi:hypothetical protein
MHGSVLVYVLYAVVGLSALFVWRFWSDRKMKRRAFEVLGWIDGLICGQGHVTGITWQSSSSFRLPLRLRSNTFRNASLRVKLISGQMPLLAKLRDVQETLVFEADLDWAPPFSLELQSYRMFARTRKDLSPEAPGWHFEQTTPFILPTRKDWQKEVTSVISSLVSCPERQFLSIVFRRESPHFSATMALDSIAPSSSCRTEIFDSLRELATGASAPQV